MKPEIIVTDERSKQNVQSLLEIYEEMINKKNAALVPKYMVPEYIQHNPLIPTSAKSLEEFFGQVTSTRKNARVVVHRVIAGGNYVWAHVNFLNLFNDDADDRGIAGVDIFKFNEEGKITEHWDALQQVPDPATSANTNGMF